MISEARADVEWQRAQPVALDTAQRIAFNCFICDVELSRLPNAPNQATSEDVIPQWMQKRFNLSKKIAPIPGRDDVSYSKLLVPACQLCNNVYMSRVEDRLARATEGDYDRFKQLPRRELYLWCLKVYYGMIYHATHLSDWRNNTTFTPTLPPERLRELSFIRRLLQGFRKRVVVAGPERLYSLLTFPLHVGSDPSHYFRPAINSEIPCFALQCGSVGIISVLDDFGTTENVYAGICAKALNGQTLHPVQFWELVGRLTYSSWITPFEFSFSVIEGERDSFIDFAPRELPSQPYDPSAEADWISVLTHEPKNRFFDAGRIFSQLMRADRTFIELEFGGTTQEHANTRP